MKINEKLIQKSKLAFKTRRFSVFFQIESHEKQWSYIVREKSEY